MCGSGLRYDEHAGGGIAGTCVGAEVDAAVDDAAGDAPDLPDAPFGQPDARIDAAACSTAGLVCTAGPPVMFSCGGDCWAGCQPSAGVSHAAAVTACTTWGGRLAPLYDQAESDCVHAAIAPATAMWIGLEQMTAAPTPAVGWSWNGDMLAPPFLYWDSGQPDDATMTETGEEQCAFMVSTGRWNDVPCTNQINRFACRRP